MQLIEKGILDLHKTVNNFLGDFEIQNPFGEREITIEDLLTHKSGFQGNPGGCSFSIPLNLKERIRATLKSKNFKSYSGTSLPLWANKVGEKWVYSNFGLAVLGYLVEKYNLKVYRCLNMFRTTLCLRPNHTLHFESG